jgi:hypothetical protein
MFTATQLKQVKERWTDKTDIHIICYQRFTKVKNVPPPPPSSSSFSKCSLTFKSRAFETVVAQAGLAYLNAHSC